MIMKLRYTTCLLLFLIVSSMISCRTTKSQNYYSTHDETTPLLKVHTDEKIIDYKAFKRQDIPTLQQAKTKGPLINSGDVISFAANAIKQLIDKSKAKYTANYSCAQTDNCFYSQLSTQSAFDPVGMQFKGFTITRIFKNDDDKLDTAFIVSFGLDTTSMDDIFNNSTFRLRLTDIKMFYTKAKIADKKKNTIDMDFEIKFSTSYVNSLGQLFDNVNLGKFIFTLRDAPLDAYKAGYKSYYDSLKGKLLDGKSFIIPRSYGYYMNSHGDYSRSYSKGLYSINVNITESSEGKFVKQTILDNSDDIIDAISNRAQAVIN
jgi:hypothetical protein